MNALDGDVRNLTDEVERVCVEDVDKRRPTRVVSHVKKSAVARECQAADVERNGRGGLIQSAVEKNELCCTCGDKRDGEAAAVEVGGDEGNGSGADAMGTDDGVAVGVKDGDFTAG